MDDCVYRVYFIPSCLLLEEDDVPTFLFVSWSNLLLALDVIVAYCLCGPTATLSSGLHRHPLPPTSPS